MWKALSFTTTTAQLCCALVEVCLKLLHSQSLASISYFLHIYRTSKAFLFSCVLLCHPNIKKSRCRERESKVLSSQRFIYLKVGSVCVHAFLFFNRDILAKLLAAGEQCSSTLHITKRLI